jgi:Family of unknown function (DUF6049)
VLRPSSLLHALAVVVTVAVAVLVVSVTGVSGALAAVGPLHATASASAATARPFDPEQPLVPRIRSITPDYVPDKGPVVIRGTVTNSSDQTWTAINVHGFMGSTPILTSAALSEAAQTPVDADVGGRITEPGSFDSIARLPPGETTSFVVRLPHSTLPVSSPGVYWFGVHVLGDDGQGGTRLAVGRDRTFLPYVPRSAVARGQHEEAALVLPVRAGVTRAADGSVLDPEEWGLSLHTGALHAILETARAARDHPLTWLLDPAVPDVVRRLAHGNPARTLTTPARAGPGGNRSSSASPSPSAAAADSSAAAPVGRVPTAATSQVARHWLHRLHSQLVADTDELLGLPYGDLAVDSAARYGLPLLHAAFRRTGHLLRPWGLPLTPAVAPPDGRTATDSLDRLPRDVEVLLPDSGVAADGAVVDRVDGHRLLLTSSTVLHGGPGPAPPHSSLALRQRVLAEAAIRLLDGQQPLVVQLPADLGRPLRPRFFDGLDVPWLRLTTLDGATAVTAKPLEASALREPPADETHLGPLVYRAATQVLEQGATLQSVLPGNHVLRRRLFEEATGNASYAASTTPFLALDRMRETARWVRGNLDDIDLAAPDSVTLASNSGRFSAIVSNALDVPVQVKIRALSDRALTISGGETLQLPAHGRMTVLLNASTHQRGVHNVTLELTNAAGQELGAQDQFPIRAEQVSRLIWVIIGVGVALLFAAIAIRLIRRILRSRAGPSTG